MDEATTKIVMEKTTAVSKETVEALKMFSSATAILMYAKQLTENQLYVSPSEELLALKNNMPTNKKLDKMMEDAKLKWKYADEHSKKLAAQMEKIVLDGQEKIKAIYAAELAKLNHAPS